MRLTLENCSCIYIGTLQKTFKKEVKKGPDKLSAQMIYDKILAELTKFTVNNQTFKYTFIKNKLGGHRWFFLCPKCGNRVSKLFLPPKDVTRLEHKYHCKACHKLKNQSAVMGQNRLYKSVTKPLKRLKEIEKKLENGYLSTEKVKAYLDEYEAIEKEMKDTPEYRLYVFKHQKGLK